MAGTQGGGRKGCEAATSITAGAPGSTRAPGSSLLPTSGSPGQEGPEGRNCPIGPEQELSMSSPVPAPSVILGSSTTVMLVSRPGKGQGMNPVQEEVIKSPFGTEPCCPGNPA